jgi:hypothetical protein
VEADLPALLQDPVVKIKRVFTQKGGDLQISKTGELVSILVSLGIHLPEPNLGGDHGF